MALENRGFLRRAVRFLAAEAGITRFLDIGTGPPAQGQCPSGRPRRQPRCPGGVHRRRSDGPGPLPCPEDQRKQRVYRGGLEGPAGDPGSSRRASAPT